MQLDPYMVRTRRINQLMDCKQSKICSETQHARPPAYILQRIKHWLEQGQVGEASQVLKDED